MSERIYHICDPALPPNHIIAKAGAKLNKVPNILKNQSGYLTRAYPDPKRRRLMTPVPIRPPHKYDSKSNENEAALIDQYKDFDILEAK